MFFAVTKHDGFKSQNNTLIFNWENILSELRQLEPIILNLHYIISIQARFSGGQLEPIFVDNHSSFILVLMKLPSIFNKSLRMYSTHLLPKPMEPF